MPWSGGVYTRGYASWSNDAASNLPISATKFDTEDNDFAAGINNCLTKDGLSTPNTAMTWGLTAAQILNLTRGSDGTVFSTSRSGGSNNPSLQFQVFDSIGVTLNQTVAALGLSLAIAGTAAVSISSARAVTIGPPTSGVSLQIAQYQGGGSAPGLFVQAASTYQGTISVAGNGNGSAAALALQQDNASGGYLWNYGAGALFFGTNNILRMSLNASGAIVLAAPTTAGITALTVTATTASYGIRVTMADSASTGLLIQDNGANGVQAVLATTNSLVNLTAGYTGATAPSLRIVTGGGAGVTTFAPTGAVSIAQPTGATALTINAASGQTGIYVIGSASSGNSYGIDVDAGTTSADYAALIRNQAGATLAKIRGDGLFQMSQYNAAGTVFSVGYLEVPQNVQIGAYTGVLADSGKHIYAGSGTGAWVIPANASVAYAIGSTLTFLNMSANPATIAINSDTLYWSPSGTTGTRTLAQYGRATAIKMTATTWLISGAGLS